MANPGDDDESAAVLSDVEAEDDFPPPSPIKLNSPESTADKMRELLAELDREKQLRIAAENSKSEIQVLFNRLKVLAHEAIKKRDEAMREKEEALKANEKLLSDVVEANKAKDEVSRVGAGGVGAGVMLGVVGLAVLIGGIMKFFDAAAAEDGGSRWWWCGG